MHPPSMHPLPPAPRILVVMLSAIGDAVHVLPVVNALKRHDPGSRISWVLQPLPATLVRGHTAVDEIFEFDAHGGLQAWRALRRELRGRRFDLVLDLQVALKGGLVTALARAPRKLGFDRARARDLNWLFTTERVVPHAAQHVQDQYFEFLAHLGVASEPVTWELGPWTHERARQRALVAEFDRPLAAIHLAASDPDRNWLPERWAAVADVLSERFGLQPLLVGGDTALEREVARAVRGAARVPVASALGSGLRELVALLDAAELVLALDSAPLHLAVALGRPTISLMSNADPRRTGPYRAFGDLVVDAYHDAGEAAPVSMRRRRGRMHRITVDEVLRKVEIWNERYRTRKPEWNREAP